MTQTSGYATRSTQNGATQTPDGVRDSIRKDGAPALHHAPESRLWQQELQARITEGIDSGISHQSMAQILKAARATFTLPPSNFS
jgi:hypothetical protein